jgi:hypothetical protein
MSDTNLFMTKEAELFNHLKPKGFFSTVDADKAGLEIGYTRAVRTVRDWASDISHKYHVRRLPQEEAEWRGLIRTGNAPIAWYEIPG